MDHRTESDARNKVLGVRLPWHFVIVDALRIQNKFYFSAMCCCVCLYVCACGLGLLTKLNNHWDIVW